MTACLGEGGDLRLWVIIARSHCVLAQVAKMGISEGKRWLGNLCYPMMKVFLTVVSVF